MRGPRLPIAAAAMAFAAALATVAVAEDLGPRFDDELLRTKLPIYEEGLRTNLRKAILPHLTQDEAARLANIELQFPLRQAGQEPIGFATDGRRVFMSVSSMRFFGELSTATAWLQLEGYTLESLTNYALMLHYGRLGAAPPAPLAALCVPPRADEDAKIDRLAGKIFSNMLVFILLHEMGHIVHGHLNDTGADAARERAQEQEADGFALDVMARMGEPPLGIVPFFLFTAHATRGREDFDSDAAYDQYLAGLKHPVDSDRLRVLAGNVRDRASAYAPMLAEGRVGFEAMAAQIDIVAATLADPGARKLMGMIGGTANEANLAPLRPGQKLGAPCAGHAPLGQGSFAGYYGGTLVIGTTSFDANAVVRQHGAHVTGALSYGAGTTVFEGDAEDNRLADIWTLGSSRGRGLVEAREPGILTGTWGYRDAESGGGRMELTRIAQP
jgi:hypothetical protein